MLAERHPEHVLLTRSVVSLRPPLQCVQPCGGAIPLCMVDEFDLPADIIDRKVTKMKMISPSNREVDVGRTLSETEYIGMCRREVRQGPRTLVHPIMPASQMRAMASSSTDETCMRVVKGSFAEHCKHYSLAIHAVYAAIGNIELDTDLSGGSGRNAGSGQLPAGAGGGQRREAVQRLFLRMEQKEGEEGPFTIQFSNYEDGGKARVPAILLPMLQHPQ